MLDILNPMAMPFNTYWITNNKESVYERALLTALDKKGCGATPFDVVELIESKQKWIRKHERDIDGHRESAFRRVIPGLISCSFLYPNEELLVRIGKCL